MIFESHAHYESEQFDEDRESLLASFKENNIGCVVNVASNLAATKASLELADKYPWIYASVGVHPSDVAELSEEGLKWLYEMCAHEKCVAVGEIGLDYYWDKEADIQEKQRFWLESKFKWQKTNNCQSLYIPEMQPKIRWISLKIPMQQVPVG